MQVQQRQHLGDLRRLPRPRRQNLRREPLPLTGFSPLIIGAALLAPVGVLLGCIAGGRLGTWIAGLGIAAATVQVVGLARWVLLVPGISDEAVVPSQTAVAQRTFELLHTWLGTVLGETIGYTLTAAFTVLVVIAMRRAVAPRWMSWLGHASAVLIATGIAIHSGSARPASPTSSATSPGASGSSPWRSPSGGHTPQLHQPQRSPRSTPDDPARLASVAVRPETWQAWRPVPPRAPTSSRCDPSVVADVGAPHRIRRVVRGSRSEARSAMSCPLTGLCRKEGTPRTAWPQNCPA